MSTLQGGTILVRNNFASGSSGSVRPSPGPMFLPAVAGQSQSYGFDWGAVLAANSLQAANIATFAVALAPSGSGEAAAVSPTISGTVGGFTLTGGVAGRLYNVRGVITTDTGGSFTTYASVQYSATGATNPLSTPPSAGFGTAVTNAPTGQAGSGLTYLTGGTLLATTSYVDITLPAQYAWFRVTLSNLGASDPANDNLCFAWSSTAGTTFIGGAGLPGTYAIAHQQAQWIEGVATTETAGFQDSLGYVGGSWPVGDAGATGKYFVTADLFPGSATDFAVWNDIVKVELPVSDTAANNVAFLSSQTTLDRSTTGIVAAARINLLRLLPYSDGGTTPATGHGLAAGGTYALWGFRP